MTSESFHVNDANAHNAEIPIPTQYEREVTALKEDEAEAINFVFNTVTPDIVDDLERVSVARNKTRKAVMAGRTHIQFKRDSEGYIYSLTIKSKEDDSTLFFDEFVLEELRLQKKLQAKVQGKKAGE